MNLEELKAALFICGYELYEIPADINFDEDETDYWIQKCNQDIDFYKDCIFCISTNGDMRFGDNINDNLKFTSVNSFEEVYSKFITWLNRQ